MPKTTLKSARWLPNHGVSLAYRKPDRSIRLVFVRAGGRVGVLEAAQLTGCWRQHLHRLIRSRELPARKRGGRYTVALTDLYRLARERHGKAWQPAVARLARRGGKP